jgi:hypothetical protein
VEQHYKIRPAAVNQPWNQIKYILHTPAIMSIVPQTGLLRKHYQEAVEDTEHKSSAFWQAYLQRAFHETDTYSVTATVSPDGLRGNADIMVTKYDDMDDITFTNVVWIDCNRPTESFVDMETRALGVASRYVEGECLSWIYVVTTIGVEFRVWILYAGNDVLDPLEGPGVRGNRESYVDANSMDAYDLTNTIAMVKVNSSLPYEEGKKTLLANGDGRGEGSGFG